MSISFRELAVTGTEQQGYGFFTSRIQLQQVKLKIPIPPVDWDREIVIGAFLGRKPTGGYRIRISRIELLGREVTVLLEEVSPQPGRLLSQAFTYPGHMVAVFRDQLPVGLVEVLFRSNQGYEQRLAVEL